MHSKASSTLLLIIFFIVCSSSSAQVGRPEFLSVERFAGTTSSSGSVIGDRLLAKFNNPIDLVMTSSGVIYIAEENGSSIKKIDTNGIVSNFVGDSGSTGFTDGNGALARFNQIRGIALDGDGNIIVADKDNHAIRKVTPAGVVTTLAGSNVGFKDGNLSEALFNKPVEVLVDADNNIYVADALNFRVRKITPSGIVSTLVGRGVSGYLDGHISNATLDVPTDFGFDSKGHLIIVTYHAVRRFDIANQELTTIVGGATATTYADGDKTTAGFGFLNGLLLDDGDVMYVIDRHGIRHISENGTVTTVAGSASVGVNNGVPLSSGFHFPRGIIKTQDGNILLADKANHVIRKILLGPSLQTLSDAESHNTNSSFKVTFKFTKAVTGFSSSDIIISNGTISNFSGNADSYSADITPTGNAAITVEVPANIALDGDNNPNTAANQLTIPLDQVMPIFTSAATASFVENNTGTAYTAIATDANTITYSLGTSNDEGLFNIDGTTGVVTFKAAPDFEIPSDANKNNIYILEVKASDGANTASQIVMISVNTNEVPSFSSSPITTISDNVYYRYEIKTTDLDNDAVIVSATGLPDWLSLEQESLGVVTSFAGSGAPFSTDGIGSGASIELPLGLTSDQFNNIYVAEFTKHTIRKISPNGVVTTLAGTAGVSGDADGQGAAARFNGPYGLTLDNEGNILVVDQSNNSIRKISPNGNVTTLKVFSDEEVSRIYDLTVDSKGNIFVTDSGGNIVVKVTPSGEVSTFVGSGTIGFTNGTGINASFNFPLGITTDSNDNIFVVDKSNHAIRKITPEGVVTTLAGTGKAGYIDGSNGVFNSPNMIISDTNDDLYVTESENHRIRKITKNGDVSTVAGSGQSGQTNGTGIEASLSGPFGITLDNTGNLFFTEPNFNKLRKVELTPPSPVLVGYPIGKSGSYTINLTAQDANGGITVQNYTLEVTDTPPTFLTESTNEVFPNFPENSDGVVYTAKAVDGGTIAFSLGSTKDEGFFDIEPSTGVLSFKSSPDFEMPLDQDKNNSYLVDIIATDNNANFSTLEVKAFINNTGDQAPVFRSNPITSVNENASYTYEIKAEDLDGEKVEILADGLPDWLTLVTNAEGVTTTLAGSGEQSNQDGNFEVASFNRPKDIAYDSNGNLFIADTGNNVIRKVTPEGMVSTFAGSGQTGFADGQGIAASFNAPWGIAVNSKDEVFVADTGNRKIRKITKDGLVTTFAGSTSGFQDGEGTNAKFAFPIGITVNADDRLFVADAFNRRIRMVDIDGTVSTFAGTGERSFVNGPVSTATFAIPTQVAFDKNNNLYIADLTNRSIRKISPDGIVSTVAGSNDESTSNNGPSENGTLETASFNRPDGIVVDGEGNIYIAEDFSNKIRKISNKGIVSTIAGSGNSGFVNGTGAEAQFNSVSGIAMDGDGNLVVADLLNNRIRKVTLGSTKLTGSTAGQSGSHTVNLKVRDASGSESTQTFTITINDTSNPVFTSAATANFVENGTTTAYTAVATDANAITYSLGTSNDEGFFDIDATSGVVTFKVAPDFEAPANANTDNAYVLEVKASDGTNTVSQTVTITVTDVDDTDPVFTSASEASFVENGTGTAYTAVATDANAITYSLGTSNDEDLFEIDGTSGAMTFKAAPDFEAPADANSDNAYILEVKASDGTNTVSLTVTITVTDVDDTAPVFTSAATASFVENSTGIVYTAVATDANAITYSLGTSNDEGIFDIDGTSGAITFKTAPDFEAPADANTDNAYVLEVKASDGTNTVSQTVTITVTDVDDTDPVFTSPATASFVENSSGTAYTAVATDANAITYSLGTSNDEGLFDIDGTSGAMTFKAAPDFEAPADANSDNAYVLEVKASDGTNTVSQTVTITVTDVDDTNPVFTSPATVSFVENGTGTAYTALATDANAITYSLGTSNDEDLFDVDGTSGAMTFKAAPDFEAPADANSDNAYVLEVKASDGTNTVSQTVTITVTDVDDTNPVFTSPATVSFVENGTGTAYTALATDANAITYSLGTSNDEGLFEIDGTSGAMTFKASPDFESPADGNTDNAYVLEVKASDGTNTASQTVTITVTNVPEAILRVTGDLTIPNTALGLVSDVNITIHNDGDGDLTINSIVYPSGFSGSNLVTVGGGGTETLTISFSPTEAITYSGDIIVNTNGGNSVLSVSADGEIVTSIEDDLLTAELIKLYPNPVKDLLNVDLSQILVPIKKLELISSTGLVSQTMNNPKAGMITIDMSNLKSGIYLLKVSDGQSIVTKKVIVKR